LLIFSDGQFPIQNLAAMLTAVRNYLVTSGRAASIKLALEALGLAGFFIGISTGDDTPEGKLALAQYQACLERFGLRRSEAIAIEDAPSGVASTRAAGLRVIGVHNSHLAKLVDFNFGDLVALNEAIREFGKQRRAA
jgi:HAD superfamily hydrolase (TIGR01509 family)